MADRVVLAYSGSAGSTAGIGWLRAATGKDVVTLTVDVGQGGEDLGLLRQRALGAGAVESVVVDAKDEFADDHIAAALRANACHQGAPLVGALTRPLVAQHLAATARQLGADSVAHGGAATGDGHVRFETAVAAVAPGLVSIRVPEHAPAQPTAAVPATVATTMTDLATTMTDVATTTADATALEPYSVEQDVWGRSVQGGVLDDPWAAPPEDLFTWTQDPTVPRDADEVTLTFERGVPVAIDGQRFSVLRVVQELNALAGKHGVGRIDVVEDGIVGVKSRRLHEAPAAVALIAAHQELEHLTLERDVLRQKRQVDVRWADLVHDGLWFGGLKRGLDAFIDHTQQHVSGDVRLRLHGGRAVVTGRRSGQSLYDFELATETGGGHAGRGHAGGAHAGVVPDAFADVWALPGRTAARRDLAN